MLTLRSSVSNVNVVVCKTVVQSVRLLWPNAASLAVTLLEDALRNRSHEVRRSAPAPAGLDVQSIRQTIRVVGVPSATTSTVRPDARNGIRRQRNGKRRSASIRRRRLAPSLVHVAGATSRVHRRTSQKQLRSRGRSCRTFCSELRQSKWA